MDEKQFIYGAHYYRPPNPPAEQHRFHLEKISGELGFNIVKYRLQWNAIHVSPDVLKLDEIHQMFDLCDSLGLNVLVEINLETAPYWLERKYPESRYVSANGHAVELGPYDATQSGGYPGLCFHHDEIRQEAERYLTLLIRALKDRKSLLGYDCWNEPHLEPAWICNYWGNMGDRLYCYCSESRNQFRQWLQKKYATIEKINRTWARFYGEWEDINPPDRHGHYVDWMDWTRFWFDSLSGHMAWRYRVIKDEDPKRFVMSHSGAVPPFNPRPNAFINNWMLAAPVDKWGTSFAPKYHNWSIAECAGTMDATRSAARGKEFWISEMTGGSSYKKGFEKTPITRPKDIRSWNWLAVAYGAKAIVYWCYLTETTGPEAGSFGLITFDGKTTERALEAAWQKALIEKYSWMIMDHLPQADVAILYDPDNSSLLFGMECGDDFYTESHMGYYKALWKNDLYARYVTYSSIDDIREKILIVPMCLTLDQKTADKIRKFVRKGGILIAEARTGLFDERGFLRPVQPSCDLAEVAGLVEGEAYCSDPENRPWLNNPDHLPWPDEIYSGPVITMEAPIPVQFRVHGYLTPLILHGAKKIGGWKDLCLAAVNRFGEGRVYYFGTYLGLALQRRDEGAFQLFSSILACHVKPQIKGNKLRPRWIGNRDGCVKEDGEGNGDGIGTDIVNESSTEALLAVFNDTPFDQISDTIVIPEKYHKAYDILHDCYIPIKDNRITLDIEPEDVLILHLEKV